MTLAINRKRLQRRMLTVVVAAAGGGIFLVAGLPLPLLLGPILGCLIVALLGGQLVGLGVLSTFMRTFLGVAVGAAVTPQLIHDVPQIAGSLVFVPLFILVIGAIGYPILRKLFGYDHATAYYAAMPGGLQDMLVFGQEAGGDVRALSLIHATRVVVIVAGAPVILTGFWGLDLSQPPGAPASSVPVGEILLMIAAGFFGWQIAQRVGLFGASILGPMLLTATLSLLGVINHRPPAEIIWASQYFIGIAVGVQYVGVTMRELRRDVLAGVVYSFGLILISAIFFWGISGAGIGPKLEAFLAFLPGGQGEMVVIAIIAGADLTYVVSHHLLRMILVILIAPILGRVIQRRSR